MNILFLDQFSDMGGAQRCLVDLLPAIQQRGWSAHLAAPANGALRELGRPYCASMEDLPGGPFHSGRKRGMDLLRFLYQLPVQARTIANVIAARGIDVVYVNGPRLLPAVALAARGRPLVFHAHSRISQSLASRLAGACLKRDDVTVIASSTFVAEPLRKYVPAERMRLVYAGVTGCETVPRMNDGFLRIGIIGRIAPEKGQLEFLQAARLVLPDWPRSKFVICGAPLFSDPSYAASVRSLASGLPVEFLSWQDDVFPILSNLDLLVVPSGPDENTPRVILEAFAVGVPVVAFRQGGIPEIVEDGRTGWLVDPEPEALAAKIREIARKPDELKTVARQARLTWSQKYSVERYQQEIVEILEGLDPQRRHQRRPLQSVGSNTSA